MQGSFWKTVAVVGVIGIGSLAILEVQHRLPRQNAAQESLNAEALAAELITGESEGQKSVDATMQPSEFDRLMAATSNDAPEMPPGGFDMSEPAATEQADENSPFYGSEPAMVQPNAAPVDTSVKASALAAGGNPFAAAEASGTIAANYQAAGEEAVQTVAFTETKPFVPDDATQPQQPQPADHDHAHDHAHAEDLRPFRRDDVEPIGNSEGTPTAEEPTYSPFVTDAEPSAPAPDPEFASQQPENGAPVNGSPVNMAPANFQASAAPANQPQDNAANAAAQIKFFGGDDTQPPAASNTAGEEKTTQFYGSPEQRLQPTPDESLATPFGESPPGFGDAPRDSMPVDSNPVQPTGGLLADPFDVSTTPFDEDSGTATPAPFDPATPDARPADQPLSPRPFEPDPVPMPREPNPLPDPQTFPDQSEPDAPRPTQPDFADPRPDRTYETPATPPRRTPGRRATPDDGTPLPFAEDVEPVDSRPPLSDPGFGSPQEAIDTPPLSIPVPNSSIGNEPPPYEPAPYEPRDNRADDFPPPMDPPANGGREFGGDREFNSDREFNGGAREFPGRDPGFSDSPREFGGDSGNGNSDYRDQPREFGNDPSYNNDYNNNDRNFGDDRGFGDDNRVPINRIPSNPIPDDRRPTGDRHFGDIRPVSGVMRPSLVLEKTAPKNATVGTPLDYNIYIRNEGDATAFDVVVEDDVTAGADVVGAAPDAKINRTTKKLMWTFDRVEPGETKEITVRVVPTGEGTLDGVATVHSKSRVKATTVITAPKLRLQMAGPDAVRLGEEVAYRYVITNEGSGEARDVYVRTMLPPKGGLTHPAGDDIEYEVQSLQPGAQREIVLTVVASEPGEFRAEAEVTAAGGAKDQAAWRTNIIGAQLNIVRRGPSRRFVSRSAVYENTVSNETNIEAFDAKVVETVPDGMKFMNANKGGRYNPETREVTWQINRLGPGKDETLRIELMPTKAGDRESVVQIFENAGVHGSSEKATTVVEDLHNVSADISRLDGPVALGQTFGFTITVDNRGTADATDVQLLIDVPPEIEVLAAGNREVQGFVDKTTNEVSYQLVSRIAANERKTFEVKLKGTRPIRNKVLSARVQYGQMERPLVVSESVTVYEERQ